MSKKPRLAEAAEALIEAASLEADAVTQKQSVANLESLKTSFDSNLNKIVQKMDSSNENFDAKINTLNQHLMGVQNEIGALKSLMEEERKRKTLESARALTKLESFEYYDISSRKDSSDLARTALDWFLLGYGCYLPNDGKMSQNINQVDMERYEQSKKDFRDTFTMQMKILIKREPRLVQDNDGSWAIYYS